MIMDNACYFICISLIYSFDGRQNLLVFFLQVLEGVIKYRWNVLPVEQRDGMKNYISDVIVKVRIAVGLAF